MWKRKNEIGNRYGRLVVTEFAGIGAEKRALWRCRCDCGKETVVDGKSLRSGNTKSCGCLNVDNSTKRIVALNTKHGKTNHPLFGRWSNMLCRCENPHAINYADYGGRGITVCEEWHDFQKFYDWAMESGYSPGLSVDRIDNSKGYSPDNCRWATLNEQAANRRSTRLIEFQGETHCLSEWARKFGVDPTNLSGRPDDVIKAKLSEYANRKLRPAGD